MTGHATIYLRQSQDKAGEGAAVSRQLDACRELCGEKGWDVAATFTDNDFSASTGVVRPGFEALLTSTPNRIVVWHVDRLVRRSKDLERVIDLGVNVHAVKSGHVDLSNPAGRAVAKTITAWAQYEGEQKADRQVAANRQRAQRGQVLWTRRPFGFERDDARVRIVKAEADEIRVAAKRVLAGGTLSSIADDWNARGISTSVWMHGCVSRALCVSADPQRGGTRRNAGAACPLRRAGAWSATSVRRVLLNPRTAGRTVSNGEDFGASGLAILTPDDADRLAGLLRDPRRKTAPSTTVKHLLSGLARCGRGGCEGVVMYATSNPQGVLVYRCLSCYGTRRADLVDEVVLGVLLARLSRPDAAGLLDRDVDLDAMRERVSELRTRRDGLAALLAEGLLTAEAVRVQAGRLTTEIGSLERAISTAEGSSPLARVVDAADVEQALGRLPILELREIIRTLMTVQILPAGKGVRFDPEHVRITWKVQS